MDFLIRVLVRSQLVPPSRSSVGHAAVFLDEVEPFDGDIEFRLVLIGQQDKLLQALLEIDRFQPLEPADAVIDMNDVVSQFEIAEIGKKEPLGAAHAPRRRGHFRLIEDIRPGQDSQLHGGKEESRVQRSHTQQDGAVFGFAGGRRRLIAPAQVGRDLIFLQDVMNALGPAQVGEEKCDPLARAAEFLEVGDKLADVAVILSSALR
jgi:hypothetical protein